MELKVILIFQMKTYKFQHADFDIYGNFITNDIALIKLEKPIDFTNPYVEKLPMAEEDGPDFVGSECFLTGWGRLSGKRK